VNDTGPDWPNIAEQPRVPIDPLTFTEEQVTGNWFPAERAPAE